MRHLARAFIAGFALISAAFVTGPVKANTITIFDAGVNQGNLSDGGVSVTFLGYTSPLTLDNAAPFITVTTTVNPANEATLTPIANTWFGTTFAVSDDHRTDAWRRGTRHSIYPRRTSRSHSVNSKRRSSRIKAVARSI